jgi:2-dehydropantoate 2-reductase
MSQYPIIAFIGAGAVGGYYGARLVQRGKDVHFLLRSDFNAVRARGWRIKSYQGDFEVSASQVHAYNDPRQMPRADLVVVTLKTTANHQFQALVAPLLKDDTSILTLQNGLGNEELLASLFGAQRVLGGNAFVCVTRTGPGELHHQAEGAIRLGEFNGGTSPRAQQIAQIFRAGGIDCDVLDDLRAGRWQKLSWNVPFNGLGAIMDMTTDRLIATKPGTHLVVSIMQEVIASAAALGVLFPADWIDRMMEKTRNMGVYPTSMQIDRREGRPLEVEAILGEPVRQARARGASVPLMEALYLMALSVDPAAMKSEAQIPEIRIKESNQKSE